MNDKIESPYYNQVKLKRSYSTHEFVIPFNNFAPLPSNSQMIQKLLSLAQQQEDDNKPLIQEEEEEDIPLGLLAYKKGFFGLDKIETAYPLIQHIPSQNTNTQKIQHYYHYPSLVINT